MENFYDTIESILPLVERPGRYAGNEYNIIKKEWSDRVRVRFALAFPDVYEIGMSHTGVSILYHILNRQNWIAAERVYAPWIDMEKLLRERKLPLFSLESRMPINRFDVVGVSLQYELQYTNFLNLLDLSNIPLKTKDRNEDDPLVIAGGPCAFNPEPLAEFLDCVVLGDGEEIILEIAETIRDSKATQSKRGEILRKLSKLSGVYVPSFYHVIEDETGNFQRLKKVKEDVPSQIHANILDSLSSNNYPEKPPVPLIEVTHDRFSLEIMRGCTRGCRFCNAGMIYRPVRERFVDDLVTQSKRVIAGTGYEEISLLSLSTSDYSYLPELITCLKSAFQKKRVAVTFPSLRPDTFTPEMAEMASDLKRGGLTFAPEAGTQRLRDVINKNIGEMDLLRAIETAFQYGWKNVKLYFMIGLPTETEDDLTGIVDLLGKVVAVGKQYGNREVTVSISPFSPKPHTPFQWVAQNSLEEFGGKIAFLKKNIRWKSVKLTWRDPQVSRLEAILGCGDRKLSAVIFRAWQSGARFDAWSDQFRNDVWMEAFQTENIDPVLYLRKKNTDTSLPWDHLNKGVSCSFLKGEFEKALKEETTSDCRPDGCQQCGLMDQQVCRSAGSSLGQTKHKETVSLSSQTYGRKSRILRDGEVRKKVRLGYLKKMEARFVSHLDMIRLFTRAIRRANIPVVYSRGYHAHPRMSMGPPLSLGYTSRAEYVDFEIENQIPADLVKLLNRHLPAGIEVFGFQPLYRKVDSLTSAINLAVYSVAWDDDWAVDDWRLSVDEFLKSNFCTIIRKTKDKEKKVDVRRFVSNILIQNGKIEIHIKLTPEGTARVEEVLQFICPSYLDYSEIVHVERSGLFIESRGKCLSPLEIE